MSEPDRDAVLLRYFEKKSAQEMALALGVSADAAQKRVNRAVERLREIFSKRGVSVGAGGLVVVISAHAMKAAPAGLAAHISAGALAGAAISTTATAATAAKTIAMTTLQKTLLATTVVILTGTSLYEAQQATQLRHQVRTLQQQIAEMPKPAPKTQPAPVPDAPAPAAAPAGQNAQMDWSARLLALNGADWRTAFALGQQLAALPPDTGFAILQTNWNSVSNYEARQQLLKAFMFADHERLPAVLELGLLDSNPEVQSWALNYLKEIALQDFTNNFGAAKDWLAARKNATLESEFNDAVWQATAILRTTSGSQLIDELSLWQHCQLFSKFPQSAKTSGLDQVLAAVANGGDTKAASLALEASSHMALGEDWYRTVALPRLSDPNLTTVAAHAIASTKSEWALQPLLDTLSRNVLASDARPLNQLAYSDLASSIAELGSPKAIPIMIALIGTDNTQNSIYGIGYFGLSKLTGVTYDEKHDGAWWRQWWANNKQRLAADVQALEIPNLKPASAAQ